MCIFLLCTLCNAYSAKGTGIDLQKSPTDQASALTPQRTRCSVSFSTQCMLQFLQELQELTELGTREEYVTGEGKGKKRGSKARRLHRIMSSKERNTVVFILSPCAGARSH